MTYVSPLGGDILLVQVSDAGSPGTYTHPCLINTDRSLEMSANATATELADCADQSAPAKIVRRVKSTDIKVSGAGVLDATSVLEFMQWLLAGTSKDVKIKQNTTGALGGWTITGAFLLTAFNITGRRGDFQEVSLTLEQADVPSLAANA